MYPPISAHTLYLISLLLLNALFLTSTADASCCMEALQKRDHILNRIENKIRLNI